jgi:hypothetical protein
VRDAHVEIVDDDREIIGWCAIRTGDDQIIELGVVEDHPAPYLVVDNHFAVYRIPEAHDRVDTLTRFFAIAATTVVTDSPPTRHLLCTTSLELVFSAIAVIGFASFKPLIGNFPVAIESVRLEERTLVSIQPQPGQAIEDCLHVCADTA